MGDSPQSGYDVSAGLRGWNYQVSKELTEDMMDEVAETFAHQAVAYQDLGFDMVTIHMAYNMTLGARFLSPRLNRRKDKYGGSVENRARFPIMIFDRIKQRCGEDFLIDLRMTGAEPYKGGITIEDSIKLAKLLEGHIDLLQVHAGESSAVHPLSFGHPTPNLEFAEKIKKSGTTLAIVTIGGFQEPDVAEEVIASGKADFINMARGWIADPNMGNKIYEGKSEDIVPCIRCMRCHDSACVEYRRYVCSVNPTIGIEHQISSIVKPVKTKKKIAIVGGGPAGMLAALISADRGHDVTLYENNDVLGGQLNFSDYVSFKFSLNKYKNYLVKQVQKSKINICLNTRADLNILEKENFDAVIGALGAQPVIPDIPGINAKNVITATRVYGYEDQLSHEVVIIGGGQVGCETALHLSLKGHNVVVLEMRNQLAPDASPYYRRELIENMEAQKNLGIILNACCTGIDNGITFTDIYGTMRHLDVESVVIAAGMKSNFDEAMSLKDSAINFQMIGDCFQVGSVESAVRDAFAAAILL